MQKGQILIWIIVGVLVIAIVGGTFIYTNYSNNRIKPAFQNPVVTSQTPQPTPANQISTEFNINNVRVGDKVGEMTIVSIQPFDNSKGNLSSSNAKIIFSGKTTITGKVSCSGDSLDPGLNHVVVSDLDSHSKTILPKLQGETNGGYIDFNNPTGTLVKPLCQTYNGKQTSLVIDNYIINSYPGAMLNNTADLSN